MKPPNKQTGAALILIAFILALAVTAYAIRAMSVANLDARQNEKTAQSLNAAKQALIAWAVSDKYSPGQMPWPDRNGDGNYDGSSDCVATAFQYSYLLGQLPSQPTTSPCLDPNTGLTVYTGLSTYPGLGQEFRDAQGNRLWYAVSRNLVRDYVTPANPVINPSVVNNPTYQWLQVLDRNGNLISNKVAAVIIAPGGSLQGQNRTGAANASQYLDSFQIGAATFNNRGYATDNEDFIMGEDSRNISASDTTFVQPYNFNDKLVYITIDELIAALTQRAAAEAKTQLLNYKNATDITTPLIANDGYYPNASAFVTGEHYQANSLFAGYLPTQLPTQTNSKSCSVAYVDANTSSSTCDSSSIASVDFTRSSGTFTSVSGAECVRTNANKTCSCNITSGTSRCNASGGRRFTCTTAGCTTTGTLPGTYVFNGVFKFSSGVSPVKVNKDTGICKGCGGNTVTCTSASATLEIGNFSYDVTTTPLPFNSVTTNSTLPVWFTANKWQDYIFYAVSSNCTFGQLCNAADIQVGGRGAVQAMLSGIGSPIISAPFAVKGSAQTASGCDVKDYLDSSENTNGDNKFEAVNKQRTSNYNDQTFVVAP